MAKRKKSIKSSNSSKILAYIAWTLALIALLMGGFFAGYHVGYEQAKEEIAQKEKRVREEKLRVFKTVEKTEKKETLSVTKRLKEVLQKKPKEYVSASHELDGGSLAKVPKLVRKEVKVVSGKPKLAIIIDDVGTSSQVRAIKSLHLPLNMSFLPPSRARPNSSKLAAKEKFYMVHLPMEALNWSAEEPNTLHIHDSQKKILDRIAEIKKLFPKVHYLNNHTGSKFTENETAMNRLIYALNKNSIHFIDSRTTAKTKAPKVLKNFGLQYMARDVFLDHHMDKAYVLKQIKQAIRVAKKHGTAVAIGHPHKNTLRALYESKKLLQDVELVLVNRL